MYPLFMSLPVLAKAARFVREGRISIARLLTLCCAGSLLLTAHGLPSPAVASSGASDRAALEALYNATGGASWLNNASWLSDAPLGEWHGVTTDDGGRVVELDLSKNRLSGQIPAELGSLSNLEDLNLGGNQLEGAIPPELANLLNLRVLELWGQPPEW